MVTVYSVRPHHAGFGMFQRDPNGQSYEEMATLDDYLEYLRREAPEFDVLQEGEEIESADGNIYDQNGGVLLGLRDEEGRVSLELVYEV